MGSYQEEAEDLALANGNNQQVAKAGPRAHGTRKGLSYKAGEPLESGPRDSRESPVAEFGKTSHPRVNKERKISHMYHHIQLNRNSSDSCIWKARSAFN